MLDADLLNRAAPPGSMRYFALLYAQPSERAALEALFAIDAELRSTVEAVHDVAHTRLQWWRGEIDRLVNRNAQHPATRALQAALPNADFSRLHEAIVAADMDLARMTYHTDRELAQYLERSGGVYFELLNPSDPNLRRAGAFIRRVETVRDLAMDARAGRLYWPLDRLDESNIHPDQLAKGDAAAVRTLLTAELARLPEQAAALRTASRGVNVLTRLHLQLLRRIERAQHDVLTRRHELGPIEKVWAAWRAARNS